MARKRRHGTKSPSEPSMIHPDTAGTEIGATEINRNPRSCGYRASALLCRNAMWLTVFPRNTKPT